MSEEVKWIGTAALTVLVLCALIVLAVEDSELRGLLGFLTVIPAIVLAEKAAPNYL